ncbi:hypothetical protein BDW59DRAFT_158052 [Aspergillus cavernicola]|uniref:Uncharacterized protein n=1 Tax=Aspergillus cavernicola TaxID=176166 RepID=A0ABR4IU52_9EURO
MNAVQEPDDSSLLMVQSLVDKLGRHTFGQAAFDFSECLSFLCRALSIAIVSFAGSHVCAFDISNLGEEVYDIPVGLGYSFVRRPLACLDGLIGGPLWVLGKNERTQDHFRLMLSLTVQDLQQLWRPVWMVGRTEDAAVLIRTERGYVVPLPAPEQTLAHIPEIISHWTDDLPGSFFSEDPAEQHLLINQESQLLIGVNDGERKMGITINNRCRADINQIQRQIVSELKLPGTCKSYYVGDGYEVNLTGGYQINARIAKKFKKMPARTHKSALIAYCASPATELLPVLKLLVGLEVSACTGNSRRVSLWDIIQLSRVKQRGADPGYTQGGCGQIDEIIDITEGYRAFKQATARRKLVNAILALEHTGANHQGQLQALWPFSDCPQVRHISSSTWGRKNNWLSAVKDTPDASTFAVFSQRCLEVESSSFPLNFSGCFQQCTPQPSLPTALFTRVFIEDPIGRRNRVRSGNDLRMGETSLEVMGTQLGAPLVVFAMVKRTRLSSWFSGAIRIQEHVDLNNLVGNSLMMITF